MRERTKDGIEIEHHIILLRGVVHVVEGELNPNFITAEEAIWSQAHHVLRIDVECGHSLWKSLSEAICTIL